MMRAGFVAFARFPRAGMSDFVALPRLSFNGCCMDESPEELEQIRREAEAIDDVVEAIFEFGEKEFRRVDAFFGNGFADVF